MKQAWFITINSQSQDRRYAGPLRKVWTYISSHMKEFCFGDKGAKIKGVKGFSNVEIGKKDRKVHLHAFIEITSEGNVRLDYSGIKKFIDNKFREKLPGFVGVYFDAEYIKNYNAVEVARKYIKKDGEFEEGDSEEKDEFSRFEV